MYAGQTQRVTEITSQYFGQQVLLFPMDCMYITQGEQGSLSHYLAMDFVGWNGSSQINEYPYYAPCDLQCVVKNYNNGQAYLIYHSVYKVLMANGDFDYITICVMHDNNPPHIVGSIVRQGQLLGHTGTAGYVTGDHMHLNVAKGHTTNWVPVGTTGFYELQNSMHIYDAMYVNDTTIYNGMGYNWKIYNGPPTPPVTTTKKKKFPWWLLQNRKNVRGYKAIS